MTVFGSFITKYSMHLETTMTSCPGRTWSTRVPTHISFHHVLSYLSLRYRCMFWLPSITGRGVRAPFISSAGPLISVQCCSSCKLHHHSFALSGCEVRLPCGSCVGRIPFPAPCPCWRRSWNVLCEPACPLPFGSAWPPCGWRDPLSAPLVTSSLYVELEWESTDCVFLGELSR